MVPSATTELVERVLDKYGDPAESGDPSEPATADGSGGENATADDGAETAEQVDDEPADEMDTDGGSIAAKNGHDAASTPTGGEGVTLAESAPSGVEGSKYPSPESLTEKQRRTLLAVAERPDATQEALASELDVCAATVSNRLNRIDGFDWHDRRAFVRGMFDTGQSASQPTPDSNNETESGSASESGPTPEGNSASAAEGPSKPEAPAAAEDHPWSTPAVAVTSRSGPQATPAAQDASGTEIPVSSQSSDGEPGDEPSDGTDLDGLEKRVAAIEDKLEDSDGPISPPVFDDSELLHKVVHACLRAETISEEEELRILQALLR